MPSVLVLLLLVSCAGVREADVNRYGAEAPALRLNRALAEHLPPGTGVSEDYRIGPEDLLEISVFQIDELKTDTRVSSLGEINVPLAGRVKAAGLTAGQLETLLAGRLRDYLEEPVVNVFIKEYRSRNITVLGAVKNPQVFSVTGRRHLLDMLSAAGGLTDEASSLCSIQRTAEDGSSRQLITIDLNELLIGGRMELNIPLEAGDVINVPEGGVFFVDGAVESPGSFRIKNGTTVTQAISMAKGMNYEAEKDGIRIYRDTGKPEKEIIKVDYDMILAGKEQDPPVRNNDVIIVPKNGFREFFKNLRSSIYTGFFSIGKGM
ncbi:MAG: polysaccharide export protein [Nitrospiraceae bacterium]|nr:polysaccharide export protein [Nitrospiraceae bacterium]